LKGGKKFTMKSKKGMATWAIILIVVGIVVLVAIPSVYYLSAIAKPAPVEVEYDGEFDDAYLATKGDFYSDFTEGTDCNITSDVLGKDYGSCIYDTASPMDGATGNSTEFQLDLVIDIDNDVENMEIEANLQNTGTGQAKDDVVIKEAELWTYEESDEAVLVYEIPIDNEDGEFEGETGVLAGDEYVLHILLRTKLISPDFADGDDIMKIKLDLTTDGDTDAARILLEE